MIQQVSGGGDLSVTLWEIPSGKRLFTLLDDKERGCYMTCTGVVKIWDATNGSLLSTFQHVGGVTSAAFTRNGQYLAVAGSEGYIAFYEVTTGQRFLSLHSLDNGGKLILLADGRFDGDEKGMEYLRYTEQGTLNSYSAKELKTQFFQPAAVTEALQKVGGK